MKEYNQLLEILREDHQKEVDTINKKLSDSENQIKNLESENQKIKDEI